MNIHLIVTWHNIHARFMIVIIIQHNIIEDSRLHNGQVEFLTLSLEKWKKAVSPFKSEQWMISLRRNRCNRAVEIVIFEQRDDARGFTLEIWRDVLLITDVRKSHHGGGRRDQLVKYL